MLPIHEILHTIQGEGTRAGRPCILVRTLGCNLDCAWCDTDQSGIEPRLMPIDAIVELIHATHCHLVQITGGEPLTCDETPALCLALIEKGHTVLVETNGSLDVSVLPEDAIRVMDLKPPSSNESVAMLWENIDALTERDEIKIVIADDADYRWARSTIDKRLAHFHGTVLLSPLTPGFAPEELASHILRDRLDVRLNIQQHKLLFPTGESSTRIV